MNKRDQNEIWSLFTEYFIKENCIDTNKDYTIEKIPARRLIVPERFDLLAKWIYIDAFEKGIDLSTATEIYRDNINAFSWGTFVEPGTETKNSLEAYLKVFHQLIEDIRDNGFDEKRSLIPVGDNDVICDGAHRVAIAAYYNKYVSVVRFPGLKRCFDHRFFEKNLMSRIHMGLMAMEYSHIKESLFFVCLWPVGEKEKTYEIAETLRQVGVIAYEQDVYLTQQGIRNLMSQIYGYRFPTEETDKYIPEVYAKADRCYKKGKPIHTYLLSGKRSAEGTIDERRIRDVLEQYGSSVYITADHRETVMMTELLYNPNSVDFLNAAEPFKNHMVYKKLEGIKGKMIEKGLRSEKYIFGPETVMEVCGIREAERVDFFYDEDEAIAKKRETEDHGKQLAYYTISAKDMIYDPTNHFCFYGLKILSIDRVLEMKNNRKGKKDTADLKLLKAFKKKTQKIPVKYRYEIMETINQNMRTWDLYGMGDITYEHYNIIKIKKRMRWLKAPFRLLKRILPVRMKGPAQR